MKSNELIKLISEFIINELPGKIIRTIDFNIWNKDFESYRDEILTGQNIDITDIKNDSRRIIMNNLYMQTVTGQSVQWDRNYVRNKYQFKVDGLELVYFPSKSPKRIIFSFSSMHLDRFDRYSRFWDPSESWESNTAYVFFNDNSFHYYLGTESNPKSQSYIRLIRQFIYSNNLSPTQAFSLGSSMGGYAAIYYAIKNKLNGAIVANPQINAKSVQAHELDNWKNCINSIGNEWQDLEYMILKDEFTPKIYLEYGNYFADKLAAESFIHQLSRKKNSLLIASKRDWDKHTVDNLLTTKTINAAILFFECQPEKV